MSVISTFIMSEIRSFELYIYIYLETKNFGFHLQSPNKTVNRIKFLS